VWLAAKAALVSLFIQIGLGTVLGLLLVQESGPAAPGEWKNEVLLYSALAFVAGFIAIRQTPQERGREFAYLVVALVGPGLGALLALVSTTGRLSPAWVAAETLGPLLFGCAGVVVSERARELS
jgi:hypothetical protein